MEHIWSTIKSLFNRVSQTRSAMAFVAVSAAMAVVFVLALGTAPVAAQGPSTPAPTGCELVLNVSWTRDASVPAGGELAVPVPPSGARIFCVDSVASGEAGAIEMTHSAVFTATVGTDPVSLNIAGATLGAALPLNESEQAYAIVFAPRSPVPTVKVVADPGAGFADVRIFWGSAKTAAGRPVGQLGSWRSIELGTTSTEIGWAEGRAREFRIRSASDLELTIAGGTAFTVEGLGVDPTCAPRVGCVLEVTAFTGGTFTVAPTQGGWVSVEASGPAGSKLELWVPQGTTAPAAATTNAGNNKGGGGFPTLYLPTPLRRTAP